MSEIERLVLGCLVPRVDRTYSPLVQNVLAGTILGLGPGI